MVKMKISEILSLGQYMTFQASKEKPVHRWFYYKEGYAPEIVEHAMRQEGILSESRGRRLLDPFCGVGTSLLAAKSLGLSSFGVDASELAVFVSRTKCANYCKEDINEINDFLALLPRLARKESNLRWEFELFSPRAAFPKRNIFEISAIREAINEFQCGQKARNLLTLALLSILPQASILVKDGGVLRIDRRKMAMPAKEAFRRKARQMVVDIEKTPQEGFESAVSLGDARSLEFDAETFDIIVTSPPYLNNVDYSKIYGLELTLLTLDPDATRKVRARLLHSFIKEDHKADYVLPECEGIAHKIPIVGGYFADMEKTIMEMKRVLKPGAASYIVVSNAVIFKEHVPVDNILAQIGERLGMDAEIIVGAYRIADVRPARVQTRESIVVLRK